MHELGYAGPSFWRDQQMHVVGHIGVNVAVTIGSRFFQPMEVNVIILLGKKARLSIDSALNNMLRYPD